MEFHAWMNPYRATLDEDTSALSQDHITKLHPEWIVKYGSKSYLNPGEPTVRHYLTSLIEEVVRKYDIDAIHFDDYFYPYKIEGLEFDDREAFMKHGLAYFQEREDWRRANVDSLVKDVAFTIRKVKPWVQFGISPFGVWRNESQDPKGSKTFANQTTYDDLYADPLNWMKNDWIDYLVPQQYWSMDYGPASYRELTGWWNRQSADHATYIGIGAYKVKNNHDKAWNDLKEIPRQLYLARSTNNIKGTVFFSARSLMKQRQLTQDLKRNFYQHPALPMEVRATDKDLSGPDIERATVDNRGKLIIQLDKKPLVDQLVVRHYSSTGILNYMKKAWVYDNTVSLDLGMDSAGITLSWLNRDNEMSVESKKINTEFKKGKWKTTWP
ncbi:MAG: family 10 glycosylhydrolase [Cyclobacteriaceae bacterium]|nr:family 10 glycosylhydrolase [Cyclobacteriaceae bacterium HetDA_MAG_MS6]